MPLVSALDGHFAVSFDLASFVGHSIDVGESDRLFQGFCLDPQSFGSLVVDEVVCRAAV